MSLKKQNSLKSCLDKKIKMLPPEIVARTRCAKSSKLLNHYDITEFENKKASIFIDELAAHLALRLKYNEAKRENPSGNDRQWFKNAAFGMLDGFVNDFHEGKNTKVGAKDVYNLYSAVRSVKGFEYLISLVEKIYEQAGNEFPPNDYAATRSEMSAKGDTLINQLTKYRRSLGLTDSDTPENVGAAIGTILGLVIGGLIILGFISILFNIGSSTSPSGRGNGPSNTFQTCNAQCEPALQSCLALKPESQWGSCQTSYNSCLARCK